MMLSRVKFGVPPMHDAEHLRETATVSDGV